LKAKLLALAVLSVPALASAAGNFNGPFLGGYLGYVDGNDSGKEQYLGATDGWTQETSPKGTTFGLLGGYNWLFANNLFVGAEADYEGRSADDTSTQKYLGVPASTYPVKTELKAAYSLRAKFGYAIKQKTAVYVTAGYAAADIKRTFSYTSLPLSESHTDWQDGWTAGVGVEHLFPAHIALRAEYRYADYGDTNVSTANVFGTGYDEKQSYDEQSLRIGVAYQF